LKFLLIGETKLKVSLSRAEGEKYKIRAQDTEYAGNEVRKSLREILEKAKEKCGFDVDGEKVLIQIYPGEDGALELFATKLGLLTERERRAVSCADNLTTYSGARVIYRFDSKEDLCSAARAVSLDNADCEVYKKETGEYYISVTEHSINGFSDYEILSEFGKKVPLLTEVLLGEWATLVCKGKDLNKFMY